MKFLYEKQARYFYSFLIAVCILQAFFLGFYGILHVNSVRHVLVEKELAAVSYLLKKEIPPALVASAWNNMEVTEEGRRLLESIGHTFDGKNYLMLLAGQTSVSFFLALLAGGVVTVAILLGGAAFFLQRREQMYEDAGTVVMSYAEEKFEQHLPEGETGAIYKLFGRVEQLALSLQAKGEAEHRAKEFLRDMISDISHQLKTPLAALNMYVEIMEDEAGQEDVVRKFTEKSERSLERMEQLIQSLLKIARLDTGNIVFERQSCLVSEVVAQAIGELLERAGREKKTILIEGERGERLYCDFEWTKEAVSNLVKNALDHTEEGGKIRVGWQRSPVMIRLTVEDDGNGILKEDIHHIFKRFYRSKNSEDRQGIGLGLPLAKMIIEGQGGNLSVESVPGEGSIFRISFPIS